MIFLLALALAAPLQLAAQDRDEAYPSVVIKLGPAAEYHVEDREWGYGVASALEFGLARRFAVELGAAGLRSAHGTEIGASLMLKRPFELSESAELMLGAGPLVSRRAGEMSAAAGLMLDLMLWPRWNHGFYIESTYSSDLRKGGDRGVGVSIGVLVRVR